MAREDEVIFTCGYPLCFADLLYFHEDGVGVVGRRTLECMGVAEVKVV